MSVMLVMIDASDVFTNEKSTSLRMVFEVNWTTGSHVGPFVLVLRLDTEGQLRVQKTKKPKVSLDFVLFSSI